MGVYTYTYIYIYVCTGVHTSNGTTTHCGRGSSPELRSGIPLPRLATSTGSRDIKIVQFRSVRNRYSTGTYVFFADLFCMLPQTRLCITAAHRPSLYTRANTLNLSQPANTNARLHQGISTRPSQKELRQFRGRALCTDCTCSPAVRCLRSTKQKGGWSAPSAYLQICCQAASRSPVAGFEQCFRLVKICQHLLLDLLNGNHCDCIL